MVSEEQKRRFTNRLLNKNKAWCPDCFDELDCVELKDDKDMISKYIYQCFGCDKWFEFKSFDIGDRAFGSQNTGKENNR